MTSCGGMLSVIVRRSTLTRRSTIGIRKTTPGPLGSSRRPSRKTTPRSYSRRILMKNMACPFSGMWMVHGRGRRDTEGCDGQLEPVERVHFNALAREQLRAVARVRSPQLPVYEHETVQAHHATHADERLRSGLHRPSSRRDSLSGDEDPKGGDREADADDETRVDSVRGRRVAEEQRKADAKADQSRDREGSVCDRVQVDDEQCHAELHQRETGPADRQDRKSEQRDDQRDGADRTR